MQRGAAESITESKGQGSETQFFPGKKVGTKSGLEGGTDIDVPTMKKEGTLEGRLFGTESILPEDRVLQFPSAPHESDPGHTYRLARSLQEDQGESYEPFPADLTRVPVPDQVLDSLDELSGCAVRLCLLMIRASYSWVEEMGQFRASSRSYTIEEIGDQAGGLGMCERSLRNAADELEKRGWIERREGRPVAYRWRLKVPRSRYTPVPAPLLHAHQGLSHSALTVLLCTLRATWGWTVKEGKTIKHKRTAELSASDLEGMSGLSRPTVRGAQDELMAKGALYARRKHAGAPYEFAVALSFFRDRIEKSYAPTNPQESSKKHAHAGETTSENAHAKGKSGQRGSAYRVTKDWEGEAIRLLCTDPFEMAPRVARDLVIRRAKSVVEGAVKAFRQRRSDIEDPAGWMHAAINDLWFGASIANKSPNVQQSTGANPIAQAFEALTEKSEGWEWGEEDSGGATGSGKATSSEGPDEPGGLDVQPTAGVTHPEMCDLIEDLGKPGPDWETVDRQGKNPLFVPTKELANWAYFRRDSGNEQFQEAAQRVVNLRARHEGRESALSGE